MITRRELLKSAIATATVRIAKEESEALEQRQHRHATGQELRRFPALLGRRPGLEAGVRKQGDRLLPGRRDDPYAVSPGRTGPGRKWDLRQRLP